MTNSHWQKTPSGKSRARGLGLPLPGTPGPFNAITDVAGVSVGYSTIIKGDGPLIIGSGPVRTGVTAILPRPVSAGGVARLGAPRASPYIWNAILVGLRG